MTKKLLDHFTPEAIAAAKARVYDRQEDLGFVCADGRCVMATLLHHDYHTAWLALDPAQRPRPNGDEILVALGYDLEGDEIHDTNGYFLKYTPEISGLLRQVNAAINRNDRGELDTANSVAQLFADLAQED